MVQTDTEQHTDLRERRRRATKAEINEAALALFEKQGMAATTVHEIAVAAGVSDRTCFRYFPSKEESVLTLHAEFADPVAAWLDAADPGRAPLPQLEEVYASVLADFDGPLASVARYQLRVRRLMASDAQLRAAAVSLDAAWLWRTAQRIATVFNGSVSPQEARMVSEIAVLGLRAAFDEWAELVDAGKDATLSEVYLRARIRLRGIAGNSGPGQLA